MSTLDPTEVPAASEGSSLETRWSGLPNFLEAHEKILASIGPEQFRAHYPKLDGALQSPDLHTPDVKHLFAAVRDDMPAVPDLVDQFLIRAVRLDLQQLEPLRDYSYLDETSADGQAVRAAIGERMGLPFEDANYLCHLSNRQRYLYVATPKVACTAIKHSLQQAEVNDALVFRHYGQEHFPHLSPLLAPLDSPGLYFEALERDDWFRFTFVRNPFSRALSCYLDKIVNSDEERQRLLPELGLDPAAGIPSFKDFLERIADQADHQKDEHWAPQSWLTQPELMRYHFVGRLECFDEDFRRVCQKLGIAERMSTVRHSTNAGEKISAFYGAEEIEIVQAIYARDFTYFGYDSRTPPAG